MSPTGVLAIGAAYAVGAIPFGLLSVRLAGGGDIRKGGSGNVGATNAFRTGGRAAGIATLALDIAKGAAAVLAARAILRAPDPAWEAGAAWAAVAGHCFPIYLGFRGGKGIATGCGAYAILAPIPMLGSVAVFIGLMLATRMVSAGSIAAGLALPLLILWTRPEPALLISVTGAAALVIARHHANIRRMMAGRENRIGGE